MNLDDLKSEIRGPSRLVLWHRVGARNKTRSEVRPVEARAVALAAQNRERLCRPQGQNRGQLLCAVSGLFAVLYELDDLETVIAESMDILDHADELGSSVSISICAGAVEQVGDVWAGRAVEDGLTLAMRAQPGELFVEATLRAELKDRFLFGRQSSPGGVRGAAIDRTHGARPTVARDVERLGKPVVPPVFEPLVDAVLEHIIAQPKTLVVLRGPSGSGTGEVLDQVAALIKPTCALHLGAAPGSLVPFASLRAAVQQVANLDESDPFVKRLLAYEVLPKDEAVNELKRWLGAFADNNTARPWVVVNPINTVDNATLEVITTAFQTSDSFSLFMRFPIDGRIPDRLRSAVTLDLELPMLRTADARTIAQAVLGAGTGVEVVRRVAVLGGDTPIGVVEAARTLVASGDLLFDGEGFVWRGTPRPGMAGIALEELLEERLGLLGDDMRRLLEVVANLPSDAPQLWVHELMQHESLPNYVELAQSLLREGFLVAGNSSNGLGRLTSPHLQRVLLQQMPPARISEIHRFCAEALSQTYPKLEDTDRTNLGLHALFAYYLLEGGLEARAADHIRTVPKELRRLGFEFSAAKIEATFSISHKEELPTPAPLAAAAELGMGELPVAIVPDRQTWVGVKSDVATESVEHLIKHAVQEGHWTPWRAHLAYLQDSSGENNVRLELAMAVTHLVEHKEVPDEGVFRTTAPALALETRGRLAVELVEGYRELLRGELQECASRLLRITKDALVTHDFSSAELALHMLAVCFETWEDPVLVDEVRTTLAAFALDRQDESIEASVEILPLTSAEF